MDAIEITGLSKIYRERKGNTVQALTDLNLCIQAGEVFGFVGPNGAGKSTTIKILMGMLNASSGNAFIHGKPITDSLSRKLIGYLPENPSFFDFLTAREYLEFVGSIFGMKGKAMRSESDRVLQLMDIADSADRYIRSYSKGMVQRLGLAQAMLHDPDIYILDEPMSGLDPLGRSLVKDIILNLKQRGKTIFFSTHITSDVEIVCDRIGVLVSGKLQADTSVDAILRSGLEGYYIQIGRSETLSDMVDKYHLKKNTDGSWNVLVPKEQFKQFMESCISAGGDIEVLEPKRKGIESFLLDIVVKSS